MSGDEEEDKRSKQLEEARRRVEELKKKSKKNKKNKNKQKSSQEGGDQKEDSPQVTSTDEGAPVVSQSEVEDNTNILKSQLPQAGAALEEVEKPELNVVNIEAGTASIDDSTKTAQTHDIVANEQHTNEVSQSEDEQHVERPEDKETSSAEREVGIENPPTLKKPQSVHVDSKSGDTLPESNTSELLFNDDNDETDFMGTIERKKEQDKIEKLMEQLENVTADRKNLKFVNMEQESTIEELQGQVAQLQQQLISCQDELQQVKTELEGSQKRLYQTEGARTDTSPAPMKFAEFNTTTSAPERQSATLYSGGSTTVIQSNIDRSALNKWRNWNVDMTTWRSIGSGPIVEF